jgi:hypothetical protein
MKFAPDALVDSVTILWVGRSGGFLTKTQPLTAEDAEIVRVLRTFPVIGVWEDAFLMAECVLSRSSCQMDLRGFAYRRGEPLVEMSDGAYDPIELSENAFHRLVLRLFRVLISGAESTQAPIVSDENWSTFTSQVAAFEARLEEGNV